MVLDALSTNSVLTLLGKELLPLNHLQKNECPAREVYKDLLALFFYLIWNKCHNVRRTIFIVCGLWSQSFSNLIMSSNLYPIVFTPFVHFHEFQEKGYTYLYFIFSIGVSCDFLKVYKMQRLLN